MPRNWLAFFLGLPPFFGLMLVGEAVGPVTTNVSMTMFYFACQFLLSRGNTHAHRRDWSVMLALNATDFVVILIVAIAQPPSVLSRGLGILLSACAGTYAGAVVASLTARRYSG